MDNLPGYLPGLITILLLTSFVKVFTSLSILRHGIGLEGHGFGIVVLGISLALALLVCTPELNKIGGPGVIFGATRPNTSEIELAFRPFLEKNTDQKLRGDLSALVAKRGSSDPESLGLLVGSFLLTELKEAFQLGFMILIPFLVIDLLVANALTALGVTQLSQGAVSLPIKLLVFVGVNGWALLAGKIIGSYQ